MNSEKNLKTRKPTRLTNFDYNSSGAYFITICTQNRKNILSTIVGEGSPLPQLSRFGKIVDNFIQEIPTKYPNISVDCYVIMPNHIHLLLSILNNNEETIDNSGRGNPSPTITNAIGWLKFQSTRSINTEQNTPGEKIFQRSFYDHIIRNYDDYYEIYKYIQENPQKWQYDSLYKENNNFL